MRCVRCIISYSIDSSRICIPCVLQRLCGLSSICVHILNKWFLQVFSFLPEVPVSSFSMMIVPREGFQVGLFLFRSLRIVANVVRVCQYLLCVVLLYYIILLSIFILVIPDPRFICREPLNNNLSRYPTTDSWCGNWFVRCSLIYCASGVWLRISSSLVA